MWISHADEPLQHDFEEMLPASTSEPLLEPVFNLLVNPGMGETLEGVDQDESDAHDAQTPVRTLQQQLLPIGASILLHACLLIVVRELMSRPDVQPEAFQAPPASIQISFRPRPVPQETPIEAPIAEELIEEPVTEAATEVAADVPVDVPASNTPLSEPLPDPIVPPEQPSQVPRLVAPALLDLRDVIRSQAQSDATGRAYNNIDCDERQRRSDLIDCGDEDPNAIYRFAGVEQNSTVEFFAELEAPAANHSGQPRDATNPDTRANVARDNLTGNLGAGPLIRSVMGAP
ncbi:hypothetical protein E3V39_14885 [Gammaproteobacteria bacterium LSUCC0112]|nr:hypothetical protein E3V39_14885 [Gammaproteobacteria bacterium LSUCC0112]